MNQTTALNFLKQYQPMPCDEKLTEKLINEYDDVRKFFIKNPSEECISLFLNSFGDDDGLGVYQLVEDVILQFDHEIVVTHLISALSSSYHGVKYWCAQICCLFPDNRLIDGLANLLNDSNEDIRTSTIFALSQIKNDNISNILQNHILNEHSLEIVSEIKILLKNI